MLEANSKSAHLNAVYTNLIHFLEQFGPLSNDNKLKIIACCELKEYKKNATLSSKHKIHEKYFFINKGSLRSFYNTNDQESTISFHFDNEFFGVFPIKIEAPIWTTLHFTEDTSIIEIDKHQFMQLSSTNIEVSNIQLRLAVASLGRMFDMLIETKYSNATEKYSSLLKRVPNICKRVKLNYIASYLGYAPETISRIRQKHKAND